MQNEFDAELDHLTKLATTLVEEYRSQLKHLPFFLPLWAKARRKGNTLQIEWERILKSQTNGPILRQYLPKGPLARYDSRVLMREIKRARLSSDRQDQALQLVFAFEDRFAEIRQAAALLAKARQAFSLYQKYKPVSRT